MMIIVTIHHEKLWSGRQMRVNELRQESDIFSRGQKWAYGRAFRSWPSVATGGGGPLSTRSRG